MSSFDFVPNKPFFTLAEVSELTGFAKSALQEACKNRRYRHQRLGRRYTMTRDQVIELLGATEVIPAATTASDPTEARVLEHRQRIASRLAGKSSRKRVAA